MRDTNSLASLTVADADSKRRESPDQLLATRWAQFKALSPGTSDAAPTPTDCPSDATTVSDLDAHAFEELDVTFDRDMGVVWRHFRFKNRPSFTPGLLRDIRSVRQRIKTMFAQAPDAKPVRYMVLASRMPGVFNLGGDLNLFANLIRTKDREQLRYYAVNCVEECYANYMALDLPIITISLVQGDALGGGFEAALSSNMIVAERSAKFGLPEVLFSLFPGMGAYSFLARRTSPALAERIILSGRMYSAEELYDLGVVDVLAEDGCGEDVVLEYIRKQGRRHGAHRAIYEARQRFNPLTLKELVDVAELWVDTAMELTPTDLRMMERLVSAQNRRRAKVEQDV